MNSLDDWWKWRNDISRELSELRTELQVLRTYQQIQKDNEVARHSKTGQVAFWIFSGAVSLIVLILQILVIRLGGP